MSRAAAGLLVLVAAVPLPVDASHLQGLALLPERELAQGAQFGAAVAVAPNLIAVGAHGAGGGDGAVYLFRRGDKGWKQDGAPITGGGRDARFGFDVALDPKGQRLLVGAPGASGCGKAFLVDLTNGSPDSHELATLPCLAGAEIGSAVAMSDQAIAVGARGADERAGRVYASLNGRPFHQLQFEGLAPRSELGQSVALDGQLLVAGAPAPYEGTRSPGAAYVVELDTSRTERLEIPGLAPGAAFGYAVAIAGGSVAVGAPFYQGGSGAVFRFGPRDASGRWSGPAAPLDFGVPASPPDGGDQLGVAVALHGGLLVAGARYAGADDRGAAYLYGHGALVDPEPAAGAQFGFGAAVHSGRVVAGAFQKGGTGVAYVFEDVGLPIVQVQLIAVEPVTEGDGVEVTVAAVGDGVPSTSEIQVQVVVTAETANEGESEDFVLDAADGGWQEIEPERSWSKSIVLGPPRFRAEFNIPTVDDPRCEDDETFTISLANGVGAALAAPSRQTVTIVNDDAGDIVLSPDAVDVEEGGPPVELGVSLSCRPKGRVIVTLQATPGVVTLGRTRLAFMPATWSTPQTVEVSAPDDELCVGGSKLFTITASTPAAAPRYRSATVAGGNVDDDHTCVTGTMAVCTYADDTVIYTLTLSNTGTEAQEDLASFEFHDTLPEEVTVVTASATSGVATVDYAGNTVAWNGSIPRGDGVVTITIVAALDAVPPGPPVIVSNDKARLTYDRDGRVPLERSLLDPIVFVAGSVVCPP